MIAWEESPRQFKMSKQLDEGKFGEDLARKFLNDPIIKVNHGISHYQTKAGKAHGFNRGMIGRTLELLWEKFQNNSFLYIFMCL